MYNDANRSVLVQKGNRNLLMREGEVHPNSVSYHSHLISNGQIYTYLPTYIHSFIHSFHIYIYIYIYIYIHGVCDMTLI
jgi:hypothetical protein